MKKLLLIVLILNLAVQLFGQKTQPKPTQTPNQAQCSLELTKTLIKEQADESKNIEDIGNRLQILYLTADFLWKHEEATAREYLAKSFELAVERFNQKTTNERDNYKTGSIVVEQKDYRFQVLRTIAKYDVKWSKKLSERILKDFETADKSDRQNWEKNWEIDSMLSFAIDVYDQNPQMSEALFNRVMSFPFTQRWYSVLISLSKKNQQFADKIYAKLLVNYANIQFKDLIYLSNYPFGEGKLNSLWSSVNYTIEPNFVQNPILQKQFLSLILQRAENFQPNET
ncbi:MAG: hypothetical protein MUC29_10350 [Pyrinomonadaceae bacterium]|nr:hypothetical protein [Pyrinomonadaceae bacterium]